MEHIRVLSSQIGARVAGSPQEDAAAAYASDQFEAWGYEVEVQDFQAEGADLQRYATLTVEGPEGVEFIVAALSGSRSGEPRGRLVDAGTGQPEEFTADASDNILLIQRDDVPFLDMATRALEAGAAGVLIVNKEPGRFPGVLEPVVDIVAAGISQADGEVLRELLTEGEVEVTLNVRASVTAHNVFARPASGTCRTLSGGHYDSVPWSPGAYDNASGSAIVLELARAAASAGLSDHCFVLWGGEEGGLQGSRFLISELTDSEIELLEGVFNYDAAAGPGDPQLIGTTSLADQAKALADELSLTATITMLPENAGSDHAVFLEAGIAALMLTAPDPGTLHTAGDTFENLIETSLQPIADLGFALLQAIDTP
ncbi:MAG: M28 family peptidase [Chloroflexi bacterium]|nr:M28 family peptidase [Chloroflexota bacterium]